MHYICILYVHFLTYFHNKNTLIHIASTYVVHINQEAHFSNTEKPLPSPRIDPRTTELPGQTLDHYAARTGASVSQIKYT